MPKYLLRLKPKAVANGVNASVGRSAVVRRRRRVRRPQTNRTLTKRTNTLQRNLYTWKSFRSQNNNVVLDMTGNLVTTAPTDTRGVLWNVGRIPMFSVNGSTNAQRDVTQSRLTLAPYVDRLVSDISIRCTHNHAVCVRFLCFLNDGWQEPVNATYFSGNVLDTWTNAFKNFINKTDAAVTADALEMSNYRFNTSLISSYKHKFLDKCFWINPYQSPSGGSGGTADTMSLRSYRFSIPIKRRFAFENRTNVDTENADIKTGALFFAILIGAADPANGSNSGAVTIDANHALVFKENS